MYNSTKAKAYSCKLGLKRTQNMTTKLKEKESICGYSIATNEQITIKLTIRYSKPQLFWSQAVCSTKSQIDPLAPDQRGQNNEKKNEIQILSLITGATLWFFNSFSI